jgi:hypothetical protein
VTRIFSFECARCGALHEGTPSLAFSAPVYQQHAMQDDASGASKLDGDFCMIERRGDFMHAADR